MANIYEMTDTWNDGGLRFDAIKMSVTDTSSASNSTLLTLELDSTELFVVNKDGDVSISGDLVVSGNTVTLNTTELTVEDKNVVIANGASDSASADGAGLTIDGADVSFVYQHANTNMSLNRSLWPSGDATLDLGNTNFRWNNIYTTDLQLSNEGGGNIVDGTWGSWTLQEGEDNIFLINHRNGKRYRIALEEVE